MTAASVLTADKTPATGLMLALARQAQGDDMAEDENTEDRAIEASDRPYVEPVLVALANEPALLARAAEACGGDAAKAAAVVAAARALSVAGIDASALAEIAKPAATPPLPEGLPVPVAQALAAREAAWEQRLAAEKAAREALQAEVRQAAEARATAEAAREIAELTAQARAEFSGCEGKPEEIAARLQRARTALTADDYAALVATMRATSTARRAVLGARGISAGAGETADEFEKDIAARMAAKPGMSRALALASMTSDARGREIVHRHNAEARAH